MTSLQHLVEAVVGAVVVIGSLVGGFILAQAADLESIVGPAVLSTVGLVGLVALVLRLVTDYRTSGEIVASYRSALEAERSENQRLRDELSGRHPHRRATDPPVADDDEVDA